MTPIRRLLGGLLLLLIFGGAFAALVPFTLARLVLEVDGTQVGGTVAEKYESTYSSRLRGRIRSYHLIVGFRTEDGRALTTGHDVSRQTYDSAGAGAPLGVVYWPPVPRLSAVEPVPWDDPVFLGLTGLSLVLFWLSLMVVVRTLVPPRDQTHA